MEFRVSVLDLPAADLRPFVLRTIAATGITVPRSLARYLGQPRQDVETAVRWLRRLGYLVGATGGRYLLTPMGEVAVARLEGMPDPPPIPSLSRDAVLLLDAVRAYPDMTLAAGARLAELQLGRYERGKAARALREAGLIERIHRSRWCITRRGRRALPDLRAQHAHYARITERIVDDRSGAVTADEVLEDATPATADEVLDTADPTPDPDDLPVVTVEPTPWRAAVLGAFAGLGEAPPWEIMIPAPMLLREIDAAVELGELEPDDDGALRYRLTDLGRRKLQRIHPGDVPSVGVRLGEVADALGRVAFDSVDTLTDDELDRLVPDLEALERYAAELELEARHKRLRATEARLERRLEAVRLELAAQPNPHTHTQRIRP